MLPLLGLHQFLQYGVAASNTGCFPQQHDQWFKDREITIDKYCVELDKGVHQAIHLKSWSGNWNDELMERLWQTEEDAGGIKLTVRAIWDVMDSMQE